MSQRTLRTLLVCCVWAVSAAPTLSQTCLPYDPDPRKEPYEYFSDADLTQADALVVRKDWLVPGLDGIRMPVVPWMFFQPPTNPPTSVCSDYDYFGQPTPNPQTGPTGALGSGALVGADLILTAGHLFDPPDGCENISFIFGYGNFTPDQWQLTCDPLDPHDCWVTVPAADVYSCVDAHVVHNAHADWAVATLDREVEGRTPLAILREPPSPSAGSDVTIVGHPNRIPMKVEHVEVTTQCTSVTCSTFGTTGHVLKGNSGSMLVDNVTRKVIGVVVGGGGPLTVGCAPFDDCKRENFTVPGSASSTPAWLAAAYIPEP